MVVTRLGAWLRAGEGIGWLAAGTMPNSLYRMPLVYLFLACVFCYSCSFLFVVFLFVCVFLLLSLELGICSSDPFCPADHVPDWQPSILLGTVEARSANVKKTTTTTAISVRCNLKLVCLFCLSLPLPVFGRIFLFFSSPTWP